MLDPDLAADALVWRLFHEQGPLAFGALPLRDQCRCSRGRIDRVLRSVAREELDDLRDERGLVVVGCEFCAAKYDYDDAALDALRA